MCLIANWKVKNKTNIFKADRVRIWLFRSTSSSLPLKPQGHEREKKGGRRRGGKKRDSFPETALKSSQLRKWLDGQRSVARKALTWQKPLNKKKGFAVCVCAGSRDAIGSQTKGDKSSNKFFLLSLFENCFFFFLDFFFETEPNFKCSSFRCDRQVSIRDLSVSLDKLNLSKTNWAQGKRRRSCTDKTTRWVISGDGRHPGSPELVYFPVVSTVVPLW